MQSTSVWATILIAFGSGAVAAFILNRIFAALDRYRRVEGHRRSLDAEVNECHRIASRYTRSGIAAPLYRLPTFFYHQALPGLLADGELMGLQPKALLLFYSEVETANRGLERVDGLYMQGQLQATPDARTDDAIEKEFGRITLKMRRIVKFYPYAKQVTAAPRPSPFQKIKAVLSEILGRVFPSKEAYLHACESAGQYLARARRFTVDLARSARDGVRR